MKTKNVHTILQRAHIFVKENVHIICRNVIQICAQYIINCNLFVIIIDFLYYKNQYIQFIKILEIIGVVNLRHFKITILLH